MERTQVEDRGLTSNWQETDDYGYSFRELMKRYKVATPGPLSTTTVKDWRYRYSAGGEREQKRQYPYQWGDTDIVYPWVYYALGTNKEQLAVYHGQQLVNMYCTSDTGRRVYFYPSEYITNGVGYTGVPEQLGQVITKPTTTASTKEYRVSDHLASLRASVEGATTRTLNYDPWGNPLSGSSSGERSTFNDQEKDVENRLYDLSDRNFNAVTGRFTKVDRLHEKYRSVSPYAYCNDNPLRLTDPTGMQTQEYIMPVVPYNGMKAAEPTGPKRNTFHMEGENTGGGTDYNTVRGELQKLPTDELQAEARAGSKQLNAIFKGVKEGQFVVPEGLTVRQLLVYEEVARRCINNIGGLVDSKGEQAIRYEIIQVYLEYFK